MNKFNEFKLQIMINEHITVSELFSLPVFLRMAHLFATKNIKLTDEKPLDLTDHFYVFKGFIDRVNLSRAAVRYVVRLLQHNRLFD